MKVGVTGHQRREGIQWPWVADTLKMLLADIPLPIDGYSSLAEGADQIFAQAVLKRGGIHHAIIPLDGYEKHFEDEPALAAYRRLLAQSETIELRSTVRPDRAFLDAGRWIVEHIELLLAVWDGEPAHGTGGTGDIVAAARNVNKSVIVIDPISLSIRRNPACP